MASSTIILLFHLPCRCAIDRRARVGVNSVSVHEIRAGVVSEAPQVDMAVAISFLLRFTRFCALRGRRGKLRNNVEANEACAFRRSVG